jgi:diadenosine tetraphosphate (Ap4A) HIT family hydrolase
MENSTCRFCGIVDAGERELRQFRSVVAFPDAYPVSEGHFLIVPTRHVDDFFGMTEKEVVDTRTALHDLRTHLLDQHPSITGFNIGANCGTTAGQTVPHAHIHLIPRRVGDVPAPRGGVRGVIPDKQNY